MALKKLLIRKKKDKIIRIASYAGFCSGVTIAVEETAKLLCKHTVYCIGDLIHNSFVINGLKKKGLIVVENCRKIPRSSHVIIRAHGLPVGTIKYLKRKKCRIYDFTCPILEKIHRSIKSYTKDNCPVTIIGNPRHAEVTALVSHAGSDVSVVSSEQEVMKLRKLPRRAVMCQSTISDEMFLTLSAKLLAKSRRTYVIDTICGEAKGRRKEAEELAKKSKMVIIVGDKKSSNTMTLAGIVRKYCPVVMISEPKDLEKKKIKYPLGIASGASSPRGLVLDISRKVN